MTCVRITIHCASSSTLVTLTQVHSTLAKERNGFHNSKYSPKVLLSYVF